MKITLRPRCAARWTRIAILPSASALAITIVAASRFVLADSSQPPPNPEILASTNAPARWTTRTNFASIQTNFSPAAFSKSITSTGPVTLLPPEPLAATNLVISPPGDDQLKRFQAQLAAARDQRRDKNFEVAERSLIGIVESNAPDEFKRSALLELAYLAQDQNRLSRAQQIFSQYLSRYPQDPSAPEILLRQGLLYRQMGVNELAVAKLFSVMTTALNLNLDRLDYYKRIVLQAKTEIAETYYLQGKFDEAADFLTRLLKEDEPLLNKPLVQFKLIRSLSLQNRHVDTVAQAENFIRLYPQSADLPEVRFLLANSLKQLGRNHDAMEQVLKLLASQQALAAQNPANWIYWQQRAGNDIANQLYREGDYVSALEIYLSLAQLDKSPAWQLPVWYQIALVYERLQQPRKAAALYDQIVRREPELANGNPNQSLLAVVSMAKWRIQYLSWLEKTDTDRLTFRHLLNTNSPPLALQ